jgi:hypothetical protein
MYNSKVGGNDKMVGFDSLRRRNSSSNKGFAGNPGSFGPMFELYCLLRGNWLRRFLKKKKGAAQPRKRLVKKLKSEQACPFCM